jgi:hypothetical protein
LHSFGFKVLVGIPMKERRKEGKKDGGKGVKDGRKGRKDCGEAGGSWGFG